ncbi:MAG: hypothetical protein US64_C0018G0007, partial [Candidatus Nomurabacteria bacterium GW2011_GWC1_37_9]
NTQSSWKLKKTLYETQLRTAFEWLINKDLEQLAQDSLKQAEHEQITNPDHSSPEQTLPPQKPKMIPR